MYSDFYQEQEMKYTEIGIVLEDFVCCNKGKIYIPVLLPEINGNSPIQNNIKYSAQNIVNESAKAGIGSYTTSNYVELRVPDYIADEVAKDDQIIKKGTEFLITFIGGEANNPAIIGVRLK